MYQTDESLLFIKKRETSVFIALACEYFQLRIHTHRQWDYMQRHTGIREEAKFCEKKKKGKSLTCMMMREIFNGYNVRVSSNIVDNNKIRKWKCLQIYKRVLLQYIYKRQALIRLPFCFFAFIYVYTTTYISIAEHVY